MSRFDYDAVVIGSGISSLTAALLLAMRGKRVCVLERYKKPGGYLHNFKRFGHTYETGAHYSGALAPGEPFHTLLTLMHAFDEERFIPLDPQGFDVFNFPDAVFEYPVGIPSVVAALSDRFPEEARGIRGYWDLIETAARRFSTYHFSLESDFGRLQEFLETSLKTVVSQWVRNPLLQSILYGHCYLHGVRPEEIAFGFHAMVVDSTVRSPRGFRGGGDAIAANLVERIESLGGRVRLNSGVRRLHTEGKKISGVELETGERIRAEHVISGVHPKATFGMLSPNPLPEAFNQRIERLQESGGIFGVYADASGPCPFSRLKNYYFFKTSNPDEVLRTTEDIESPSVVFATRPDRVNKSITDNYPLIFHAPGPIEWFAQWRETEIARRPIEYREKKERLARIVLDFVQTREPEVSKVVKRFETSTPLSNRYFNGSEEGSGYGIYHSMKATGIRAIGPRTRISNLVLAGQSTLMPGLLGAALSGVRAAGCIVGMDSILKDLIEVRDR